MKRITLTLAGSEIATSVHPTARELERILRSVAETCTSPLLCFTVDHGTAAFQFDSTDLTRDIARYIASSV